MSLASFFLAMIEHRIKHTLSMCSEKQQTMVTTHFHLEATVRQAIPTATPNRLCVFESRSTCWRFIEELLNLYSNLDISGTITARQNDNAFKPKLD